MPSEYRWILGLDIGGTNVVVGMVPLEGGNPLGLRRLPTLPEAGGEEVVRRVVQAAEACIGEVLGSEGGTRDQVAGVGIGAPGPLNRKAGILLEAPNLGWRNFPLESAGLRGTGLARRDRQRRQLRHLRRVVDGCGPGIPGVGGAHPGNGDRRRLGSGRGDPPRRLGRCGGVRPYHHRLHRKEVQMRQLWVPRGLRVGSEHRRQGRGGAGGRGGIHSGGAGGGRPRQDHGGHGL